MQRVVILVAAILGLACLGVTGAAPAYAGDDPPDKDTAYLALIDTAAANPKDAHWCEIRDMYPDTSFYRAQFGILDKKMTAEAGKHMLMEKTRESVTSFQDYMRKHAGSAGAHFYAAYLYKWNNDLVKEKMDALLPDFGHGVDYINPVYENKAAHALLDCLTKSGDGRTIATAYKVVTVEEEEIICDKYYQVEPVDMRNERHDGHAYNIVTITIPGNKTPMELYFQLDDRLLRLAMEKALADKMAQSPGAAGATPP